MSRPVFMGDTQGTVGSVSDEGSIRAPYLMFLAARNARISALLCFRYWACFLASGKKAKNLSSCSRITCTKGDGGKEGSVTVLSYEYGFGFEGREQKRRKQCEGDTDLKKNVEVIGTETLKVNVVHGEEEGIKLKKA